METIQNFNLIQIISSVLFILFSVFHIFVYPTTKLAKYIIAKKVEILTIYDINIVIMVGSIIAFAIATIYK